MFLLTAFKQVHSYFSAVTSKVLKNKTNVHSEFKYNSVTTVASIVRKILLIQNLSATPAFKVYRHLKRNLIMFAQYFLLHHINTVFLCSLQDPCRQVRPAVTDE